MRTKPIFQKNDALSCHDTTLKQRKEIHQLIIDSGYKTSMTNATRDARYGINSNVWDADFLFEYDDMIWRARRYNNRTSNMNFKPYSWWIQKLTTRPIIDNSGSTKNTFLDEQLKTLENEKR